MKLIIDIPEEEYKDLMQTGENTITLGKLLDLRNSVRNGTPLDDVKAAIDDLDVSDLGKMGIITAIFEILDKHIGEEE